MLVLHALMFCGLYSLLLFWSLFFAPHTHSHKHSHAANYLWWSWALLWRKRHPQSCHGESHESPLQPRPLQHWGHPWSPGRYLNIVWICLYRKMLDTWNEMWESKSIILSVKASTPYLVTRSEVDGEEVPEEESRHVVQDQAIQRQVQRCNPCLLLLERQQSRKAFHHLLQLL